VQPAITVRTSVNAFAQPNPTPLANRSRFVRKAVLVLEFASTSTSFFRVRQADADAQELIGPLPLPLVGATLDQLPLPFNLPALVEQLQYHRSQGSPARFRLKEASLKQIYDCQILPIDDQLLVLSLETNESGPEWINPLEQVIEAMPIGLALFDVIRNEKQEIIDFQAVLCNQMGARLTRQSREDILARPISERYPGIKAYELFQPYVTVVTTGQPYQQLLLLPSQNLWMDVSVVKYGDGLLVSFQDVTQSQATADLLKRVMSSSPASVRYYESIRDEDGRIIDFMTGMGNELSAYRPYRPAESTTGQRLLDLYPYLRTNGLFDRYVAVVESGQNDQFETAHELETHSVWFDCRAVPHGKGFVLTTLDITVQKQAQLARQRQATVLQTVLDNSQTGMAWFKSIHNSSGQLIDFTLEKVNATLAQTLGQPPHALEGKRLSQLMPHQMTNGLFDRYAAVAQTAETQRFIWPNDTGTFWYDISAVAVDDGLIVTFMDISAIKLAELDRQRQADLLQGVLNSSASSILVLDPLRDDAGQIQDFRISLANPATQRLFAHFVGHEFSLDDLLTYTLLTLFPSGKERALFSALIAVVSNGQPIKGPVDYPQFGLTYEYDISSFRDGVLMITTDITPLRVYQQQLEANNVALVRSNEYLQQFAYVASHDLQEPLRKIQAFSDLLLTQYAEKIDSLGQDLLKRQQSAAQRMQTLVKDLLEYSRLTNQQLPFEPLSLQGIVQGVLNDLETTIRGTGAQVTVDDLPTIPGNATQLRQLLQNLIANALKFAQPGLPPEVRVQVAYLRTDQLPQPVLTTPGNRWIALTVADNGIGFDESHRERIFELFHRLHGRSQYTGTGIGLAVVKKVVENHRGFITATSQPGAGSTFTVYLPLS
jgi:signal transduction histidine kinase